MFPNRELITNPWVLIREEVPPSDFKFVAVEKKGDFFLIKPRVAREVYYLQMLNKNVDVFLPTEGEGLLVTYKAINSL